MAEWETRMDRVEKDIEALTASGKRIDERLDRLTTLSESADERSRKADDRSRKADERMDHHIEFVGGVIVKMERHLEAMSEKMDKSLDTQNEILKKIQASVVIIENNAFGIVARLVKVEERLDKLEKK